ncbi:aminopeptidase P family protein [Paludibacter sp.]|uniref:aminopeptidase P family protein n=1 Tax=Paludibacter sp. TaxID=1898105 RepID=UPI0013539AB4|nr:aminopeptidase P family protein [Paludibacter sp.]MTK52886.1 aminopeptidase P family protein [Paludibacter sp.]
MPTIPSRLAALRQKMATRGVAATIIPSTDPHASEYVADYWKERQWISGFTGSAGTVVVTEKEAGLWTDSRYFLQADLQLQGTGIALFKDGLPETPSITAWLGQVLPAGSKVGINPLLFSVSAVENLQNELTAVGLMLVTDVDFIKSLWRDRPALPDAPVMIFSVEYSGKSAKDKIAGIREIMTKKGVDTYLFTALDEIAWIFNIRCSDVDYNPVAIAFGAIDRQKATLFVNPSKISHNVAAMLADEGVDIAPYNAVFEYVATLHVHSKVMIDKSKTNFALYQDIPSHSTVISVPSPIFYTKAIKNSIELAGTRNAMIKDGAALTRFFMWLEANITSGKLTELSIAEQLCKFRAEQPLFKGESFGTIAGYKDHGAIVHYSATEESNATLQPEGFLLLDSGGQYLDGTTDITRTVSLGALTEEERLDFTLVLKGHIALGMARFPQGTRGSQLDILARKALWDRGWNYGHGTGHGVGHFLCVHEGPQSIRMDENPTQLVPGMVISNEPGLYRSGKHGIRSENLVTVVEGEKTEFGQFYQFETLTLFPFDTKALDTSLLSGEEKVWLNEYHQMVYERVSPLLSEDEKAWLKQKCAAI